MKTRISTIVAVLTVAGLLLSGNAFAEKNRVNQNLMGEPGGPPSAEEKLARMSDALGLDDKQAVELLLVLQDKEEKHQALHEQTQMLMGPEICALMFETEEEILAILTPEQTAQFMQMKEERRARAESRGRKGRGMGPPDCSEYEDGES